MSEMSTKYNPQEVEANRYSWWLEKEVFKADNKSKKNPYTIVIPPPNVTGKLHIGHAWDTTLQDMLTRFKRLQGYDVLYLPGMDHAGIATQAKVEERLRQDGILRHDIGREKFLEKAWEWKDEYAGYIREQWAKLGLGLDYSRERFTLDKGLSEAVTKIFVDHYNKGIIYRGEGIINWDPVQRTALSNIEVIYKDIEGAFYHLKYFLADGSGDYLEVATTRPETLFGDTAVAVNPKDERYTKYIGKKVLLPITGKEIPVIADTYVEMDFGSGVVKITPAHDPNDFEVGNRHDLERIVVMDESGIMNEHAAKYAGQDRFECRKNLITDLEAEGICFKIEKHIHSVGHSERSGAVIEPYLSKQWFIAMKPLAERALENQKNEDSKVHFYPNRFEGTFTTWMENVQDWCISRQLWWGHRIPAWYHNETGEVYVGTRPPADLENYTQDEDVLDTWFSSALWPFSTLEWPNEDSEDFKRYYPTNTLVTGYDIIFFWVSRMIFQGLDFTGKRPFKDTLIHGLVRDEQGRKMSKSLGNGVDPMEVIEQYGADSLRYFLATNSTPGQDLRYSKEKIEASWNYINKIWNASRFVIMNLEGFDYSDIDLYGEKTLADKYILTKLAETSKDYERLFEKYEFGEASRILYNFIWEEFCSWYIEIAKISLNGGDLAAKKTTQSVLIYVLDASLKMLHPFMPFVTEEIWQHIPHKGDSIVTSEFVKLNEDLVFEKETAQMQLVQDVITLVRNIRSEVNAPMSREIPIKIKYTADETKETLLAGKSYLEKFAKPSQLIIEKDVEIFETDISRVIAGLEIYVSLADLIDVDKERERLEKELEKLQKELELVNKKLSNEKFVSSAPEAVVNKEKEKLAMYQEQFDTVEGRIKFLNNL
ncbi:MULTISPECIES: valine--tRNA ligase [unclassified Gemella]|uniref:valine--tRNA ligase n=1 Tax=unclassified Gemella TaxID=2624949 RepID=UPI0010730339|nr:MULTISPECIES: valine--tRNA ligase [unclassified Gemella]MBF0710036.1 valine--tRNA ligase [Gemella sp. GL1.1]MBF0746115.1 valine--tRNA ligase [Gemella sp. 19428wG2_WT2a]NYS27380.1 valine--tRNA ligase [Gemella sp. GL1]TFU60404.1 valine--tRNA ligase [Gemella sp. WT2a]